VGRTASRPLSSIACAFVGLVVIVGVAVPAYGQAPPLARLIPAALAEAARTDPFRTPEDHTLDFVPGVDLTPVPAEVNAALALQSTTFPANLAWGGRPSPEINGGHQAPARAPVARSSFVERASTLGRDSFSFGFVQQSLHYSGLDGLDIEDSELKFFLEHNDCCGAGADPSSSTDLRPAFERDLLEQALSVDIDRNVFTFLLDYGVMDRLDIGLAVPLVKVNLRTRVSSRILRLASEASPITHKFDPLELAHQTTYASGSASGLGDLVIHGKYAFMQTTSGGLAASVNLTLPTADSEDLLGAGVTRTEGRIIWSEQLGGVGAHANASYTWSSGDLSDAFDAPADPSNAGVARAPLNLEVPDEIGFVAGVDVPVVARVGVSGDVVMRHLRGVSRFASGETTFPSRAAGPLPAANFVAPDDLQIIERGQDVTQVFGALGVRVHLGRLLLVSADLLFPISEAGLVPRVGAVAGFSLYY
jgi:hypothetical protein